MRLVLLQMVTLVFLASLAQAIARTESPMGDLRGLATCDASTTCNQCNSNPSCSFLNGKCDTDPRYNIGFEPFISKTSYEYCNNGLSSGMLDLSEAGGNKVELFAQEKASASSYPICEWRVRNDYTVPIKITLRRNRANYEDVFVYAVTTEGQKYLNSKDFSSWDGAESMIKLEGVNSLRIRVKILNDASSYKMTVEQDPESLLSPAFVAMIWIMAFTVWISWIAVSWYSYVAIKRNFVTKESKVKTPTAEQRNKEITQALDSMKSGEFGSLQLKYSSDKWVICLCNFEQSDQVVVTKECQHPFHSECLTSWFENISLKRRLKCPICKSLVKTSSNIPHNHFPDGSDEAEANFSVVIGSESNFREVDDHQDFIT